MPVRDPIIDADADLERRIDYQTLLLHTVTTPEERRAVCDELTKLVGQRSPERVRQMEAAMGIR